MSLGNRNPLKDARPTPLRSSPLRKYLDRKRRPKSLLDLDGEDATASFVPEQPRRDAPVFDEKIFDPARRIRVEPWQMDRPDRTPPFVPPYGDNLPSDGGLPRDRERNRLAHVLFTTLPTDLSAEASAANARLAKAITGTGDHSDLLPLLGDALQNDPAKAAPEVADLIRQVGEMDKEKGEKLAGEVRNIIESLSSKNTTQENSNFHKSAQPKPGQAPAIAETMAIIPGDDWDNPTPLAKELDGNPNAKITFDKSNKNHVDQNLSEQRKRAILEGKSIPIMISENSKADGKKPWYEISSFSQVTQYEDIITETSEKFDVDKDLVKAIIYIETTHGYYDIIPELANLNKSIRPMNINIGFWKGLGYNREEIKGAKSNIEAGVKIINNIQSRLSEPSIEKIATLYNNLGATTVSDYGARVKQIYKEKPWRE